MLFIYLGGRLACACWLFFGRNSLNPLVSLLPLNTHPLLPAINICPRSLHFFRLFSSSLPTVVSKLHKQTPLPAAQPLALRRNGNLSLTKPFHEYELNTLSSNTTSLHRFYTHDHPNGFIVSAALRRLRPLSGHRTSKLV